MKVVLGIVGFLILAISLFYGYAFLSADQYLEAGESVDESKRLMFLVAAGLGALVGLLMVVFAFRGRRRT